MRPHLIILGAGAAKGDEQPWGLQRVTLERRVIDWQLDAFASLAPEVSFVGGYDVEQVMKHFPNFTYHFNAEWETTGSATSLAIALAANEEIDEGNRDLYITYSDIMIRPALVGLMAGYGDDACLLALDTENKSSRRPEMFVYDNKPYEFVGLLRIPARLLPAFRQSILNNINALNAAHLSHLMNLVPTLSPELKSRMIIATGLWGHAEHGRSVARFILGTKAATLDRLKGRLRKSRILPLRYFKRTEWESSPDEIIHDVILEFKGQQSAIVRSSATDEDGFVKANAGRYHSELNVSLVAEDLRHAVEKVFSSYSAQDPDDEVLFQPQLDNVQASGVIFTRVLNNGAPYMVINYVNNGDTTAITSGSARDGIKLVISRSGKSEAIAKLPSTGRLALEAAAEIEKCVCHDALDIEFAINKNGEVLTLQVRPLMVGDAQQDRNKDEEIFGTLDAIENALKLLDSPPRGHLGSFNVWSVMADWNPAEILGLTPAPLAFDLYRYIITDHIWSIQRKESGYRDLKAWPLIRNFGGQAFVDVRASINSFIPASLPESIATLVIEDGLTRLRDHPEFHDKIEFEIVPTCLDFNFEKWEDRYKNLGIDEAGIGQFQAGLRDVTRTIIGQAQSYFSAAEALESEYANLEEYTPPFGDWLKRTLDICRDEGALIFAHLARAGFVAVSLLNSAVTKNLITEERRDALLASITTVGGMIATAAWSVKCGTLPRGQFVARFGHLRPGTYHLSTPAYHEAPEVYIDPIISKAQPPEQNEFGWTAEERTFLDASLNSTSLGVNADELLAFIRTAIAGREYSKFVFTRLLSQCLEQISKYCDSLEIPKPYRESLCLDDLMECSTQIWKHEILRANLISRAEEREKLHRLASLISLPPVILRHNDVYAFQSPVNRANFITNKRILAPLRILDVYETDQYSLEGCIVAIPSADPGFDFIFSLGVCGLITAFGGPNSHMAIRAAEFSIPAVIGIGSLEFENLEDGVMTEIDGQMRRWQQETIC